MSGRTNYSRFAERDGVEVDREYELKYKVCDLCGKCITPRGSGLICRGEDGIIRHYHKDGECPK